MTDAEIAKMSQAERDAHIKRLTERNRVLLDLIIQDKQKEYFRKQQESARQKPAPRQQYAAQIASNNAADQSPYVSGGMYRTAQPSYAVPDINPASTPELPGHTLVGSPIPRMNPNEVASLLYAQQQLHADSIPLPEHIPETGQYRRMREVEQQIPIDDPVRRLIAAAGTPYGIPGASAPQIPVITPRPEWQPAPPPPQPTREYPNILRMLQSFFSN